MSLLQKVPANLKNCIPSIKAKLDFDGPLGGIDVRYRGRRPPDSKMPDIHALAKVGERFPELKGKGRYAAELAAYPELFKPHNDPFIPVDPTSSEAPTGQAPRTVAWTRILILFAAALALGLIWLRRRK